MLTYKSRTEQIQERIAAHESTDPKKLHYFEPPVGQRTVKRHLVMSSDVKYAITEDFPDNYERHAALLEFFLNFAEGGWLQVSENPAEHPPDTAVARVHRVEWELWDLRVYADDSSLPKDKRSVRVCGGFAGKDIFVALTWAYREDIGDEFDQFVIETRKFWDGLFAPFPPFHGATFDEYLSNADLVEKT